MGSGKTRITAVSILLHALVVAGLFLIPGLVRNHQRTSPTTPVRAVAPEEALARPPEPMTARRPEVAPNALPLRLTESPPVEEPLFEEPGTLHVRDLGLPPIDLPPSRRARATARPAPTEARPTASPPAAPTVPSTRPTRRAAPAKRAVPAYPRRAVRKGLEGKVLLLVEVLPDGSVGTIDVKESSGHAILDEAAKEAVRKWHFEPAFAQGQPIRSLVEIPFNFRLDD